MLHSAVAAVRSTGTSASAFRAATIVPRPALRSSPWVTPHPERRLLRTCTAAVLGSSMALMSKHAGRNGLRLSAVHGSGAAELPAGTKSPLLSAHSHEFSTSTGAGNKLTSLLNQLMGARHQAVAPSVILVKVGDTGKHIDWATEWDTVKDLRAGGLLEALASTKVFGSDLKDVKLSGCSVSVFKGKLLDGAGEPTAADEADASKVVELNGANTVGSVAKDITAGDIICIRVRLPGPAGGTPAAATSAAAAAAALSLREFGNVVIAPAASEVLKQHQAAVKIFADSSQDWPARLAALNEISAALLEHAPATLRASISLPLLDTESHLTLLAAWVQRAEQLQAGNYERLNGVACRLLLGARGIGKTNLMLALTYVCSEIFDDVIPLFVTGTALSKKSSFQKMDLEDLMIATARAHGVDVDESKGASALTDALANAGTAGEGKKGKRMLIVVDEIEQLYRADDKQPALRLHAMHALEHLQELGNQKSGRYAVLLCGSSAATYNLIRKTVNVHLLHRFPLLQAAPELNRTKFLPLRIPAALCTATAQVERILATLGCVPAEEQKQEELLPTPGGDYHPATLPRKSLQLARLLTFFVGTTPRAIASALERAKDGVLPAERLQELVTAQLVADLPAGAVEDHAQQLFVQLLRLLQDANKELRDLLRASDGAADTTAVMMESWEDRVKPLEWEQVQHAWSELAKSKQLPDPNSASYVTTLVNILTDASLVSLRLDPGTSGRRLWPASAAQLIYSYQNTIAVKLLEGAARELQPLVRAVRDVEPLVKAVQPLAALKSGVP